MLFLTCPECGIAADETEFLYGGEAGIVRPQSVDPSAVSADDLNRYLNERSNPRGSLREQWCCSRGCGSWFLAMRDTVDQTISAAWRFSDEAPDLPGDVRED